jgi:hypothetical protein
MFSDAQRQLASAEILPGRHYHTDGAVIIRELLKKESISYNAYYNLKSLLQSHNERIINILAPETGRPPKTRTPVHDTLEQFAHIHRHRPRGPLQHLVEAGRVAWRRGHAGPALAAGTTTAGATEGDVVFERLFGEGEEEAVGTVRIGQLLEVAGISCLLWGVLDGCCGGGDRACARGGAGGG